MKLKFYLILFSMFLFSCTQNVVRNKNEKAGKLVATHYLVQCGIKKIPIDDDTPPMPLSTQMIEDAVGNRILTTLNTYKNAIYFYDYESERQIRKICYEKEGPNGIPRFVGYYIINMDSIYVYNNMMPEAVLTDSSGIVKQRISLWNEKRQDSPLYFPQYSFSTIIPFMRIGDKLILTGFSPTPLSSQLIDKFRFTACIDLKTGEAEFLYTYPEELYGSDSNWEGGIATLVYPELTPAGEIIHSFSVSHNLYIAPWNSTNYKTIYGGSNNASTIQSFDSDPKATPREKMILQNVQEDLYTAIRYDPYRKVYYRIFWQGISGITSGVALVKKPIAVIIMDEQFNYMGETVIGTGEQWNWKNFFVTREGLNIEYIGEDDFDEDYLTFKIFNVEKIDK